MVERNNEEKSVDNDSIPKMLDKIVKSKVNGNRRYVDEVLEKIQDKNREYYLARFAEEMKAKEAAENAGQIHKAQHHKVMAETFKSIAERCFTQSG